jgi:nucleoside-diphosphate-sugar epimerase
VNAEREALARSLPGGVPEALSPGGRVVVTGCAGFIGSHLCEALLALGCRVTGVDSFNDYYDPAQKREHVTGFADHPGFTLREANLLDLDPVELLAGARAVFHLAAQAGVRASWGASFELYTSWNVLATQRLLEACLDPRVRGDLVRFVYSSSSSVYGDQRALPVGEDVPPAPRSPYGVTKLAAEHLCVLYTDSFGVPTASLRYFTVYGPRQRPDMAFRKYIERALDGEAFQVYGDGRQTRDFTYVDDAVRANLLALHAAEPGPVYNVGGGTRIALRDALDLLQGLLQRAVPGVEATVVHRDAARGDVRDTYADRTRIEAGIGYRPTVAFEEGLAREVAWAVARRPRRA